MSKTAMHLAGGVSSASPGVIRIELPMCDTHMTHVAQYDS